MRSRTVIALTVVVIAMIASAAQATFSIVVHDPQTGELGIAVQSRAFSVGAGVPWAEAGVGAIATQSATNESFGPRGLSLLRSGYSAGETLDMLLGADPGRENRQVGIVDAQGRSAAFTGSECSSWAGDSTGVGISVQGNILAGPDVVAEMVRAYHETSGEMAQKLIAALHAGQAAGGDKRGQQSAALLVVRESAEYPEYRTRYVDLRVEDHEQPIAELERVFRIHQASDLLEAHVRYARSYSASGNAVAADRERQRIGDALAYTLAQPDASASTLNALAWTCAIADVFLEESLLAAERAVQQEPENFEILDTLAEVHFRMGNTKKAVTVIDRALKLAPDDKYLQGQRQRFLGS